MPGSRVADFEDPNSDRQTNVESDYSNTSIAPGNPTSAVHSALNSRSKAEAALFGAPAQRRVAPA